jgi:hypothetical protein
MEKLVEMMRITAEPGGRDRFSCSLSAWDLFRHLGQTFGWQPQGATYLPAAAKKPSPAEAKASLPRARHDYVPGVAQDSKHVDSTDALEWARALERARSSPHLHALIASWSPEFGSAEATPPNGQVHVEALLDEFIQYAYGGEFAFFAQGPATT